MLFCFWHRGHQELTTCQHLLMQCWTEKQQWMGWSLQQEVLPLLTKGSSGYHVSKTILLRQLLVEAASCTSKAQQCALYIMETFAPFRHLRQIHFPEIGVLSCTCTHTISLHSNWHARGVSQRAKVYYILSTLPLKCEYYT